MLQSLDAAYEFVTSAPRRRSPVEAHWRLNRAYADLIFAWAYSRDPATAERAQALLRQAKAALPRVDAVHQMVLRAYVLRIGEPAQASPWTRLDLDLSSIAKFDQYRVIRLLEQSAILSRVESRDAATHYWASENVSQDDALTELLLADGAGSVEAARAGFERVLPMLDADPRLSGASLIGPSTRAGCEPELYESLRRRYAARPTITLAAALVALGDNEIVLPKYEETAPYELHRIAPSCQIIGALALSGRINEAEAWVTAAWREANDSFTTNSHYSIMPLRVCETLVLSVLRHELALGSRGLLESAKPKPAYGGSGDASPIEERNEGPDEISKLTLLQALMNTQAAFERASEFMVGPLLEAVTKHASRFRALVSKHAGGSELTEVRDHDPTARVSVAAEVKATIQLAQAHLVRAHGSCGFQFLHEARGVLSDALEAAEALDKADRHVTAWLLRLFGAIGTIETCLRSAMVEQPRLSEPLQRRIAQLEGGDSPPREATLRYLVGLRFVDSRTWNEAPVQELMRIATLRLGEARRRITSPPVGWAPLLEPVEQWLTTAAAVIEEASVEINASNTSQR